MGAAAVRSPRRPDPPFPDEFSDVTDSESSDLPLWQPPPPGPQSRFFTTSEGLKLHYLDWPVGDAAPADAPHAKPDPASPPPPVIVMVHGRRAHCRWFDPVAALLRSDFKCLSMDLRSHGDSDRGSSPALFSDYGADIAEFLHFVSGESRPVILMPHSMAGRAAISALVKSGFRPDALILADTPMIRRPHHSFPEPKGKRRVSPDFKSAVRRFRLLPPGTSASREVLAYIAATSLREAPGGGWEWKYDLETTARPFGVDLPDLAETGIETITSPTLVIYGEHSALIDEAQARRIADLLPDAEVRCLRDAHHHLILDRPEEFVRQVRDFLSRRGIAT